MPFQSFQPNSLITVTVALSLLCLASVAQAVTLITFRDLTDNVSIAINGAVNPPGNDIGAGESIFSQTFQATTAGTPGMFGVLLTERDSGKPSDFLFTLVSGFDSRVFFLDFFSDPSLDVTDSLFISLWNKGLGIPETADPLNITNLFRDINGNPVLLPGASAREFVIEVQSDANARDFDVPEPPTLLLFGMGLAVVLRASVWRRH